MITTFPKESFDKLVVEHKRSMGKYISKSAIYIGKKAQVTMGKSVGATRFDFKFDFEKCKKVDFAIMIMDADKKLNGSLFYFFFNRLTYVLICLILVAGSPCPSVILSD